MAIIPLRRGDDFVVTARFTTDGDPQDMTGWTLEATLRYANCTPVELATEWTDEIGGVAAITLGDTDTPNLAIGEHELQVRAISPAGVRSSSRPVTVEVRD